MHVLMPRANAVCERFLRSVRRECLDHLLIFGERQLGRVLKAYAEYLNQHRPHQGLAQGIPQPLDRSPAASGPVRSIPILGGLHHTYTRAA